MKFKGHKLLFRACIRDYTKLQGGPLCPLVRLIITQSSPPGLKIFAFADSSAQEDRKSWLAQGKGLGFRDIMNASK